MRWKRYPQEGLQNSGIGGSQPPFSLQWWKRWDTNPLVHYITLSACTTEVSAFTTEVPFCTTEVTVCTTEVSLHDGSAVCTTEVLSPQGSVDLYNGGGVLHNGSVLCTTEVPSAQRKCRSAQRKCRSAQRKCRSLLRKSVYRRSVDVGLLIDKVTLRHDMLGVVRTSRHYYPTSAASSFISDRLHHLSSLQRR